MATPLPLVSALRPRPISTTIGAVMRKDYLSFSLTIGLVSGAGCFYYRFLLGTSINLQGGDFHWAIDTARALIAGRDPYAFTPTPLKIPYPLPVAVFGLPVAWLPDIWAASIFFGHGSALLAYMILLKDKPWRLLCF